MQNFSQQSTPNLNKVQDSGSKQTKHYKPNLEANMIDQRGQFNTNIAENSSSISTEAKKLKLNSSSFDKTNSVNKSQNQQEIQGGESPEKKLPEEDDPNSDLTSKQRFVKQKKSDREERRQNMATNSNYDSRD